AKPTRDDLLRTLRDGLPGTGMPSFARLPDDQLEALIDYVVYLSLRGETELMLVQQVVDADDYPVDLEMAVEEYLLPAANSWQAADSLVIVPPPPPDVSRPDALAASLARGREIFLSKGAQCSLCHGPEGRGDGEQSDLYDDWNRLKKGVTEEQTAGRSRLYRLPLQQLRPRDFTAGIFHGGSDPRDIYHRVYVGIKGTPMPPAGPMPGSAGVLSPEEIWDVVHFVRSLADLAPAALAPSE
ncbi:MAG: c-type cytochrome, partial [Planctomycetota bacterium]